MMSDFKNMKIRTTDAKHCKETLEKLYELGYGWGGLPNNHSTQYYGYFYTYDNGLLFHGNFDQVHFDKHPNEEYILTPQGTFMKPEDYFKQPETPPMKEPSTEKPPLGLIPRHVRDTQRLQEILEAMHRYSVGGKVIPKLWAEELAELLDRQQYKTIEIEGVV
jgi:hypothetical protein